MQNIAMKHFLVSILFVVAVAATTGVVYANTHALYTTQGFVEELISRGIIPSSLAPKARELVQFIGAASTNEGVDMTPMNAEHVHVRASQLIENSKRTYVKGSDVQGLLVLVENTHTEPITLEAKRRCQVVYRIYENDVLLYDSATTEKCETTEKVEWMLGAGDTRMFPVKHEADTYTLEPGEYSFELDYPGYGVDTRTVTITE
jgi:hypothetical protein